jgi:hypothetical protein
MRLFATGFCLPAGAFALALGTAAPALAAQSQSQRYAETRTRIIVHPRTSFPGPNAKRYCRSWLAREYRVSGTVIVPRMRCWWQ